jgi:hypothetical protein
MDKIIIHHAYNGFLYAPVFLADRLGLFPKNCELRYSKGDAEAIRTLGKTAKEHEKHWFAVCDPFSEELAATVPPGDHHEWLCLVAAIINRAPVWLYNSDPGIRNLKTEQDIEKHASKLSKISTYRQNTTGHLFGERLRGKYLKRCQIVPCDFGDEFKGADAHTLVVTSDVLRVVWEQNSNASMDPIILSYPERGPDEIKNFLFTGLVTLRQSVLKENLDVLLAIIGGLKKAIHFLNQEHPLGEHIVELATHFDAELVRLGLSTDADKREHIKQTLQNMRRYGLYWERLTPDTTAAQNAKNQWAEFGSGSNHDPVDIIQKIPSILLSPDRLTDVHLQSVVLGKTQNAVLVDHPKIKELFAASLTDPEIQNSVITQMSGETLMANSNIRQILAQRVAEAAAASVSSSSSAANTSSAGRPINYLQIGLACIVPSEAGLMVWYLLEIRRVITDHGLSDPPWVGALIVCLVMFVFHCLALNGLFQCQRRKFWFWFVTSSAACPIAFFGLLQLMR